VIFDNASVDDIASYVRGLNDPRIVYRRSEEFLPVTDSWNAAIEMARGDYVTLLGDDDGLTPGYFVRLESIVKQFGCPDIIYSSLYQFVHPNVAPWEPGGYLAYIRNGFFFVGQDEPFEMSPDQVVKARR